MLGVGLLALLAWDLSCFHSMTQRIDTDVPSIVVLDGHTLNPGDLSWHPLEQLGSCVVHARTAPGEVVGRLGQSAIALTNKVVIDANVMDACPTLRYIGVMATGTNVVDVAAAQERGIVVTNVPGYSTASVAQMVFAHILHFTHSVALHSESVHRGEWSDQPDFCYWLNPLRELDGQTMGLVGFGKIAQAVATLAQAFGMRVLMHKPSRADGLPEGVSQVDLRTLFEQSDFLSLHCPLTPDTHCLVNRERLAWMKAGSVLINTGRGDLVDEAALAEALRTGHLAGAGIDVSQSEPISPDSPLLGLTQCSITPHIAWATCASRQRLLQRVAENLRNFLQGNPVHVVRA